MEASGNQRRGRRKKNQREELLRVQGETAAEVGKRSKGKNQKVEIEGEDGMEDKVEC